jgi:tRNA(Ile)-lysidine synthase
MAVLAGNLVDRVGEFIPRYSMLCAGDRIGVAVSGGADSVALLHILHRLTSRFAIHLTVLHVNHRLRGAESDGDEAFVRQLAASFGLELVVAQAPINSGNVEQEARRARLHFFRGCMAENNLRRVALGHTRSDQAETVLFRLVRGCGLAGLAGMRPVTSDGLIRPLLNLTRADIREWARSEGLEWREDSSNANPRFARNRLRNEALPLLTRDYNPNLESVLAGLAELARDEEDYWVQQIGTLYLGISKRSHLGSTFQVPSLNALHVAVRRRVIRRALADIRGNLRSLDMEHIEAILAICSSSYGHDRVMVPGVDAFRSFDTLLLARPGESGTKARHYRVELKLDEGSELPFRAGFISVNRVSATTGNCATFEKEHQISTEFADLDSRSVADARGPLAVRNWEPGDELQRPGHRGAERIKSLFQEHRILLWERRHWPVLVAGNEIVWVRRFGPAAKFIASAESQERIRVIYRPVVEEKEANPSMNRKVAD